jgi:hypothetical protein
VKFSFIKKEEPEFFNDFWYDITVGGGINLSTILTVKDQILEVESAINTIEDFKNQAEKSGVLEEW